MFRFRLLSVAVLLGVSAGASTASHGVMNTYTGSISIGVATIPPVTLLGGGVATVNNSAGGLHLTTLHIGPGDFAGTGSAPVFNAGPISGLLLAGGTTRNTGMGMTGTVVYPTGSASNMTGSFANLSGGAPSGGVMGLSGVLFVCLFAGGGGGAALGCGGFPASNLVVPLAPVGAGGATFATAGVNITAIGAPWTIGTAAVQASTVMGFAHGTYSVTSTTARGSASGIVQLVTPVFISPNLGAFAVVPAFATLYVNLLVPEPGTLALLGSGVTGLAWLGHRRRRRG